MKNNFIIGILAFFVIILSGTIVYFWENRPKCVDVKFPDKYKVKTNEENKIENINDEENKNVNEFQYNYQNTEFAEKEKQVLEIGKKESILVFGEKDFRKEMPFKVKREKFKENNYNSFLKTELNLLDNDYIWHFSGTLPCKEGYICKGGTIEVIISDKDLKVLKVFHSK